MSLGIAFKKRFGVGLFGGEGFIMQRLQGDGWAFVHAGGTLVERILAPGETLASTPAASSRCSRRVHYDIQFVGGIKTALFGGEGLFFATLTGPGKVWLQSLPFSRLAGRVLAAARPRGRGKEEGSLLGSSASAALAAANRTKVQGRMSNVGNMGFGLWTLDTSLSVIFAPPLSRSFRGEKLGKTSHKARPPIWHFRTTD